MAIVHAPFGEQIPFGDPSWYQEAATPYYKNTHAEFRAKVRAFVEKEIVPFTSEWEQKGEYPQELHRKCYEAGIYGSLWPKEYGGTPPPDYDTFHELILYDEFSRTGANGITAGLLLVMGIALPPVLNFGSEYLKQKIARDVITAQKFICLAITEPFAGSDVASIQATARKEGEFFIVNGQKKFISGGHWADFFVTAVRTGGPGMGGVSLLVIEKNMPGITVRRLPTQGWLTSHTTHIVLEDVKVPVKNLIGKENQGFKIIMTNFNHERLVGIAMTVRNCRICLEESIKYAKLRKTFGKPLIQQQVIRHKIGKMIYLIESLQAQQEAITFQLTKGIDNNQIAAAIALLKVQGTRALEKCAREASQILGGNSFLRSGPGEKVERVYREVRVAAIGAGSEEIMLDLGVKLAKL